MSSLQELEAKYRSASEGFDHLFSNQLISARETFSEQESPFHLLGLGVCAFLEAALGMETTLMAEATRCLTLSEAGARKQVKAAKSSATLHRFQAGIEWEILHADAVVLLGLTHALSESYRGYLQCLYELNSAHSKFTKLYKTVYPAGLDAYSTPATTPAPSPKPSTLSLNSLTPSVTTQASTKSGFFGRWTGSNTLSVPTAAPGTVGNAANGTIEELILGGTAFGFGLFNLVFSLLPAKVRGVVGFFGFNHDRKLALQALAVSAARTDVHAIFAGLVLMTYHGVILLMSGYQADEAHIIKQYKALVEKISSRYPTGALWILNRAKILRMTHDAEGAIKTLQDGLKPEREHSFSQADTLLVFELAWTLLAQRRFEESSEMFIRMTELNTWSHATYYFIAAGCQFSLQNYDKAQELFDKIPDLLDKRKLSGKDLPTEVFIKKKLAFYKKKQQRRGGAEGRFVEAIKISPAEEIAIFWNAHARIDKDIAIAHIKDWSSLSPPVNVESAYIVPAASPTSGPVDLDTPDELAVRSLLLAIVHRTLRDYSASRAFLADAQQQAKMAEISSWVSSVSIFELTVLELKEADATCLSKELVGDERKKFWIPVLKAANEKLDQALALATSNTDLSSRLDSRISMLRDEITTKSEMIGIV
ncbi:hypothetical protein SERLA73DRAFT_113602 [Serpula lacrymans var. lacrymans S7.3]|uniref:Mitochondrial outer membrane protein IML2 n=2 Tax=Serpula lacrymans var. lacrymans TaxID=341189 RepID=F8Q8J4_SERL3|nr:uncharacterized protein SERLADRAFT_417680 [Serpula lacrymans var. lacrymans S7.9]EGN95882.1 hypothetical protein SERLA73DRAFT_113602 [Serpula lacrymans var. lacrymans S7.3]EGO21395.1 hypothetical protein SERLADRAFT_417680 [Serpula lacrymans var. lacrymans S7.9]